ncbi:hypothetical protein ACGF3G_09750 [Streptomyces sp. NPDC048179]|uniref:hypothetical protein n=1 Tax=Streptomyces sp. NPDC048179 TaxID=3365506 RepID=UPI003717EF0B
MIRTLLPSLDENAVVPLTTYAVAGADGLFVHRETNGDAIDLSSVARAARKAGI